MIDKQRMEWTREPREWAWEGDGLAVTTEPGTDLWQRTYYHFRNDNAPALQLTTDERFFSFVVRTDFTGAHHRFDQCGVVAYLDSENWIKGSVEYEDGLIQHLGSVVTNRGWSDWATTEIPADVRQMWYRLSRRGEDFRIDCSDDGQRWRQMRVCHLHEGTGAVCVGVYACSPEDSSFVARFSDIDLLPCAWEAHDGQQPDDEACNEHAIGTGGESEIGVTIRYGKVTAGGVEVFYRECGDPSLPTMVLLHGFPSSSHMFRELMPMLEDRFHCVAPDYPGFGQTESPSRDEFAYTFDHLAEVMDGFLDAMGIGKFYLYVFDYGAPIGFRVAMRHPERILGIVSQNGNVYEEGLGKKWEARAEYWAHPTLELREQYKSAFARETVIGQYTLGTAPGEVAPDGYELDLHYAATIDDYAEKQSDLIFDYQTNVALYPRFQEYLRTHQPRLLAIWGKDDPSFVWPGAEAFARDLPGARIVPVDSGHFALENRCAQIAEEIKAFL